MKETAEINIGEIIEQKSKKKLPKFLIKLLERLIHQREINELLSKYGNQSGGEFATALLADLDIKIEWSGLENLPADSRQFFVCNHPLGGIDGIAISAMLCQHYGDVRYMVNDILLYLKPFQKIFLPVNTYGKQTRASIQKINEALASDLPFASFPAGYCSRYLEGEIQDRDWQKSFIRLAKEHKRDIVPLHFVGQNSKHFYWIDRIRKALGIKFDLSTALLADEVFRAKGKTFKVIVGQPISWESLDENPLNAKDLAQSIRRKSYELKK